MDFDLNPFRFSVNSRILMLLLVFLLAINNESMQAQQVNFNVFGGNGISIGTPQPASLNFGQLIKGSEVISQVLLSDQNAVCFEVEAPMEYDVSVYFDAGSTLISLDDTESSLPANFRFAYNNRINYSGACEAAKSGAIQLPLGFNSAVFPVKYRASGPPTTPPGLQYQGSSLPKSRFYLYVYGSAGPAGVELPAGTYETEISIHIELNGE